MELLLTNKYSIMNSIPLVFWLIPIASVVALGMAWFFGSPDISRGKVFLFYLNSATL